MKDNYNYIFWLKITQCLNYGQTKVLETDLI